MRLSVTLLLAAGLALPGLAQAHEYVLEDLVLVHPFATPAPPGVPHAAAYVDIRVEGETPAVLIGARTPASESVGLYETRREEGEPERRRLERIEVPAGITQLMRPEGGYHLMLEGLVAPLGLGERFPMTLEFAERGEVEVEVWVQSAERGSRAADGHHHDLR
ncbi:MULTISPECIES: copper chaperone PCu(A)C [Halomonas]|jgi:copper(I)-binding protein|uniref:Copper chaperone PCu(A)C n=1 Tax=Halomonas mongoliensis TaxID=321265 RepID=A0ABU1GQM2_9GAMM|nr:MULTISPECIES: copper chaperone PCu(A)C [Halomonas]MDR5893713.1 copper chaperone PCu(A)C [Halomonas mongoliensis]